MTDRSKVVLMVAAENGALPHGKVGGIGDVIRDLPGALADRGWSPVVVTPAYGILHRLPKAEHQDTLQAPFAGGQHAVEVYRVAGPDPRVNHVVLEHPAYSPRGQGVIYCDDGSIAPFATDATKFAAFSAAVATYILRSQERPDVLHLHDWHAAFTLALRLYDPIFAELQSIRTVFTIHNLALQGIRPVKNDPSSLESWYPTLKYARSSVGDPRYADCINPMALAIRASDSVSTVSPTYATEILKPNDPDRGFYGGEGLEDDLREAHEQSRLLGILNGCNYADARTGTTSWKDFRKCLTATLDSWISADTLMHSAHYVAANRLATKWAKQPGTLLTSIGRITAQKVGLFLQPLVSGLCALEEILQRLGSQGRFVMLGSGDPELEQRLVEIGTRYANFLFLKGYAEALSSQLYTAGDLFLMPSRFEPCGISQMIAMREGQPCVVHDVGGLRDTVKHLRTGFVFGGISPTEQAENFVATVSLALSLQSEHSQRWRQLSEAAAAERFDWAGSAQAYEERLYVRS